MILFKIYLGLCGLILTTTLVAVLSINMNQPLMREGYTTSVAESFTSLNETLSSTEQVEVSHCIKDGSSCSELANNNIILANQLAKVYK